MGGGAEEERQSRVVPFLDPVPIHGRHEMVSLPLPDELLPEILLPLPTSADLVRASTACVSFRRVATHRSFLRRYRKLHAPPLLGFLDCSFSSEGAPPGKVFYPATPPHPSASAASVVASAADFSFSFLPGPAREWRVEDIRDGRVVLLRWSARTAKAVVCDPLYRRYILLPRLACDLDDLLSFEIFLVPSGCGVEAATADKTSFRAIAMAQYKTRLVAFAISSSTRQWRAIPSRLWTDLSAGLPPSTETGLFCLRQCVYGCFYWLTADSKENKLLVFDAKTMEFSIAEPPPEANSCSDFAMVEAGAGRPGMFVLAKNRCDLSYFIRQNDGGSQWQKVKTIAPGSCIGLICNMEKYLLLHYRQSSLLDASCFTLDIETFHLEKVCSLGPTFFTKLHAYSNFPPPLLSSPTISSGVKKGPEKEMLEQARAASSSAESAQAD